MTGSGGRCNTHVYEDPAAPEPRCVVRCGNPPVVWWVRPWDRWVTGYCELHRRQGEAAPGSRKGPYTRDQLELWEVHDT
jgi:hypothetical protein